MVYQSYTPKVFKKLQRGATNFFNKLPSTANNIVKKVDGGLNQGLGVVQQVPKQVSNGLEKAAPIVDAVAAGVTGDPIAGAQLTQQMQQAASMSSQASNMAKQLKSGNLGKTLVAGSNNLGTALQGIQFQSTLQRMQKVH